MTIASWGRLYEKVEHLVTGLMACTCTCSARTDSAGSGYFICLGLEIVARDHGPDVGNYKNEFLDVSTASILNKICKST